jgi:CYTH domain-containing protein
MAIENERKYVLFPKNDIMFLADLECLPGVAVKSISQAYLPGGPRIRSIENKNEVDQRNKEGEVVKLRYGEYKFTYKIKIGEDLVEIETDIPREDYYKLHTVSKGHIHKTRVVIPEGDLKWEVDFFHDYDNANLYLIMAEVELPVGVDVPKTVPQYISENLLFLVPRDDRRFDNSNLSDPYAVRANVEHIRKEKEQMLANVAYFTRGNE